MKLLAVSLQRDATNGMQIRHKFFDVEKETSTCYKVKATPKCAELINNRTQIRKDEVDKVTFNDALNKRNCISCTFSYINLFVWVIIESDEPSYDLLRYWRKCVKEKALEELKQRNQALKSLYNEVSSL
jgi:hypothetical protein